MHCLTLRTRDSAKWQREATAFTNMFARGYETPVSADVNIKTDARV
jgi:hypothetical protein